MACGSEHLLTFYILGNEIALNQQIIEKNKEDAEYCAALEKRIEQAQNIRRKITTFIDNIPDSLTRQVFTLKVCEGLTWAEIAAILNAGTKPQAMKQRYLRYLEKTPFAV